MSKAQKAAQEYLNRKSRATHPSGRTDNGGRWLPSESEKCDCCDRIRTPSRAYPWSLMLHCRTAKHIANLYGVSEKELKAELKGAKENE